MTRLLRFTIAIAVFVLAGCGATAALHSPEDYANAVALDDPDGSLTTIVGPNTEIVKMTSTVKFPQGDTSPVRSVLMYYAPARSGTCTFQIGYMASHTFTIVKEEKTVQPCDGKQWAHFHIAGTDISFVGHLDNKNYKGTPVTLLEISDYKHPDSIRVTY